MAAPGSAVAADAKGVAGTAECERVCSTAPQPCSFGGLEAVSEVEGTFKLVISLSLGNISNFEGSRPQEG